jgi:predicted MFS family arabinose efflux permease
MRTQDGNQVRVRPVGILICLVGLIAIAFSIILRIEPGALYANLLSQLHTSPEALSALNTHYQYSLIAALVIAGIVVDIAGPRLTLTLAMIVAIFGNYLFSDADSLTNISYSRILIGYAHPFILISVLTLGTLWLPRRHFAFFVGLVFATILMLPAYAAPYLSHVSSLGDLHTITWQINAVGTAIILFILFTLRAKSIHVLDKGYLKQIFSPLTQHQIWLIAFVSLLGWIPNTFLLNYGSSYLTTAFHILPKIANDTVKISFSCFALGAICTGLFAGLLEKNHFLITAGYVLASVTFAIVLFAPGLNATVIASLLFATGIFASVAVICYAYAYDYCRPGRTGITFGLVASITTIGNTLMARFIGSLFDHYVHQTIPWHWIVIVVPLSLLIGAIIATSLRKPPYLNQ